MLESIPELTLESKLRSYVLLIFVIVFSISGCAPIEIVTKYEPDANFNRLKSYQILENQQKDLKDLPMPKGLLDNALENAFTMVLGDKGYTKIDSDPDFQISYYIVVNTVRDTLYIHSYYNNVGYYGSANLTNNSKPRVDIVEYQVGSLVVDIIDARGKRNIWRGSAATPIGLYKNEKKQMKRIATVVRKVLEAFPPN